MTAAIQAAERYASQEPTDEFASGYWTGFETALRLVAEDRLDVFMRQMREPGAIAVQGQVGYSAGAIDGAKAAKRWLDSRDAA